MAKKRTIYPTIVNLYQGRFVFMTSSVQYYPLITLYLPLSTIILKQFKLCVLLAANYIVPG